MKRIYTNLLARLDKLLKHNRQVSNYAAFESMLFVGVMVNDKAIFFREIAKMFSYSDHMADI